LRQQVLNWQLTASLAVKDKAAAEAAIDEMMAQVKTEDAAPALQRALDGLIDVGQQPLTSELIQTYRV
jgi:hypothetical protein